ncbi:MAG: hypothetical protein OXS32_10770, partial [Verrucomicrobiales bacterium]|nr:hypothetical protein [Verrucomicrobiales bacterium]
MFSASAQQEGKDSSQPAAAAKPVEKQASPAGQAAPKGKPTIVKVTPKPSKLFTALDVDLDGYISLSEIEAAVQVLKNLDANQDGQLTINEFELTEEPEKKISRVVVRPGAPGKPPAVGRPTRPGRRPTAKPTRPGARPKRVATAKRPSTKPTRPGAKSRPARRPGRPVASKATKPAAGASNQVSSTTARKPATPSRVVKSTSARRKPKSASRVKPGGVAIKNPQKTTATEATTGE